jgi:S1-C subfamily serine protease
MSELLAAILILVAAPREPTAPPGAKGFLGVQINSANDNLVTIQGIVPDTAAARAGLQVGDVLTKIGTCPATDTERVIRYIGTLKPNTPVIIEFMRAGEPKKVRVKIGIRPPEVETDPDE